MEKRHIVKFLNEKRRGIYTVIVEVYAEVVQSTGIRMALEVIKEDLEKVSEGKIELSYFGLAQAIGRYKKKLKTNPETRKRKFDFKDAHELKDNQVVPGRFKLNK